MDASRKKILIVDDEVAIADLVHDIFEKEGFEARTFYNAHDALDSAKAHPFDIAIVDVMMPGMDGFELCVELRKVSDMPVVFLTAKDQESDVVCGLTLGADDYIVKPFKPNELVARVKAHLRRASVSKSNAFANGVLVSKKGIELNSRSHKATLHDIELPLSPKEFGVLETLMGNIGQPVSANAIYESVWRERADSYSVNTVMVHIRHLRKKLAEIDSSVEFVETVWGVGYKIAE